MKVIDFIQFHDEVVTFVGSNKDVPIQDVTRIELAIRPIQKGKGAMLLNATSNFLTSSISNLNEPVHVQLNITTNQGIEEILLNEEPLIRGSDDYLAFIERARRLKDVMSNSFKKHGGLKK